MTDPNPETGKKSEQTETISKTEHEQAIKAKDNEMQTLKKSIEDQQLKLLDPEYLEFLDNKRKKATNPEPENKEKLGDQLLQEIKGLKATVQNQQRVVSSLAAYIELEETKKQYPDFNDFKDDIDKVIEAAKGSLSFEQAYLIAKGQKAPAKKEEEPKKKEEAPKGSEKPGSGSIPPETEKKSDYQTAYEAGQAAVKKVQEKYGLVGDTI